MHHPDPASVKVLRPHLWRVYLAAAFICLYLQGLLVKVQKSILSKVTPSFQSGSHLRADQVACKEPVSCSIRRNLKQNYTSRFPGDSPKTIISRALWLNFSFCSLLASLFFCSYQSQEHSLINILYSNLHVKVCFFGTAICDIYSLTFCFIIYKRTIIEPFILNCYKISRIMTEGTYSVDYYF